VPNCLLQSLSDIFDSRGFFATEKSSECERDRNINCSSSSRERLKARGEWFAAIAALEDLLLNVTKIPLENDRQYRGVILSGPIPILSHPDLVSQFHTRIFTPVSTGQLFQLPACGETGATKKDCTVELLPLSAKDPIAKEQFCLVLTDFFSLSIVLGKNSAGVPVFEFSFEPRLIRQAWQVLRSRSGSIDPDRLNKLDGLIERFAPVVPDYRIVSHFSRNLLKNLPDLTVPKITKIRNLQNLDSVGENPANSDKVVNLSARKAERVKNDLNSQYIGLDSSSSLPPEVEFIKALTHEIRTPLTTIRTLTKLLLKRRRNLTKDTIERLESIDRECTEQINRMELIFRAAELETKPKTKEVRLVAISLEQIFQNSIPGWQKQAQRRNAMLDFVLPKKLPQIISDPEMLDRLLTGLMENLIRSLPSGGKVQVTVTTAGDRLKLQLLSQKAYKTNPLKSLGRLLMFQPETGGLCLNLDVTKNLFHALGGKLIVRNSAKQGEVLTIFLPLGTPKGHHSYQNVR